MRLEDANKKRNKDLVIALVILIIAGVAFHVTGGQEDAARQALSKSESEVNSLKSQISKERKDIEELKQAFADYDAIDPRHLPTAQGLTDLSSRYRAAAPVINNLSRKYHVVEIVGGYSEVTSVTSNIYPASYTARGVQVYENKINLSVKMLSDELFFRFLKDMMEQLPGYVKLESFSLARIGDVNRDSLTSISQGQFIPLVEGEAVLSWKTLKGVMTNK